MRISPMPQVCSGLLCGLLIATTGCSSPSSQNLDSLTVTATPATVAVGGAAVLKAMAHLSDGTTQDVTAGTLWTVSNPTLATMSNGAVTAKAPGTVTIQAAYVEAAPAGTSPASATVSPQNLSASTQITITSITAPGAPGASNVPAITWNAPAAIPAGTALGGAQLNATANVPGIFAYTPAAGTVLKAGPQTLFALFTPTDLKNYSAATATVQITVSLPSPAIAWATPAPIPVGTALTSAQLDATASVPGSFVYNPAVGTVLPAGTQQLTTVFTPTDVIDYSVATAHTSLVVSSGPVSGPVNGPVGPGTIYPVPSGASTATIQSTINTAAATSGGATVSFASGGTWTITSQLHIPCPASALTITGPPIAYPGPQPYSGNGPYLASLSSQMSGTWMWTLPNTGCTKAVTVQYLNLDGGQPSPDGGGVFYFPNSGGANVTITNNYIHGVSANASGSAEYYDALIWMDGQPTGNTWTNVTISWNALGGANDCNAIMALFKYQGATFDGNVGLCSAISDHTNTVNLLITNNSVYHVEEAFKFYEGGSGPPNIYVTTNLRVLYNDFSNIHRCPVEAQMADMTISYNSVHDDYDPGWASWGFSMPQLNYNYVSDNVMAGNVAAPSGNYIPGAYEYWGSGTSYNNLVQGYWQTGWQWGYPSGTTKAPSTISNNTVQLLTSARYIVSEGYAGTPTPIQSGNVTGGSVSAVTSVAPSISPASGGQTYPLSVTLTDPGYTSGSVPSANTGIWYTTDGSTPVPGAGTAQYASSGGTIVLNSAATIKAVGMWGAQNQPRTYASGYGFVPSAVVTAGYTSGSIAKPAAAARISRSAGEPSTAPTSTAPASTAAGASHLPAQSGAVAPVLQSVEIVPSQPAVAIGSTTQLKAVATFNDASTKDVTADFAWTSSDPRTVGTSAAGLVAGLASGQATISGSYQGHRASVGASSAMGAIQWSGPIVITQGGTYSGNWQSNDPQTPAVTIATRDAVIVENSHIQSIGSLIKAGNSGSDLTVRNNVAVAMNASVKGQPNGIFLEAASPARLDVENNYIENARGGIVVHGYSGDRDGKQTIVIRANRARNLNGLQSDGSGGYLSGAGSNRSVSRFIELDSVQAVPGIDVGWNEVINYPGRSLVSDNIDVNRSGGTLNQPLEIHDTYIQGAYPYRAAVDAYTGGGIKTEGKPGDSPQEDAAFNNIHDNQVVGTVGYGIEFTAGHDNIASNNRVISSGLLADSTKIAAQHVGMANGVINEGGAATGSMYNNTMRDNLIGWSCWSSSCSQAGYRKDQSYPASPGDYSSNSVLAFQPITLEMENNEYQMWLNKMVSAAIAVGPSF